MREGPVEQLPLNDLKELVGLMEWFDKLRQEALEAAEQVTESKTSGTSGGES